MKRQVCLNLPEDTALWLLELARQDEAYKGQSLHWARIRRALQHADPAQKYGGQ